MVSITLTLATALARVRCSIDTKDFLDSLTLVRTDEA